MNHKTVWLLIAVGLFLLWRQGAMNNAAMIGSAGNRSPVNYVPGAAIHSAGNSGIAFPTGAPVMPSNGLQY